MGKKIIYIVFFIIKIYIKLQINLNIKNVEKEELLTTFDNVCRNTC